eukprot:14837556-Alexandrium_andersonii.AAC.1
MMRPRAACALRWVFASSARLALLGLAMMRFRSLWVRAGGRAPGTAWVPQCLAMKLPSGHRATT